MARRQRLQSASVQTGIFLVMSMLGIALVYRVFSDETAALPIKAAWLFYAPAWILCNAMFGGIHGAPAWSFWPSIFLAVVGQNIALWLAIRWLLQRNGQGKSRRSETP